MLIEKRSMPGKNCLARISGVYYSEAFQLIETFSKEGSAHVKKIGK
jgi:hypothetical protein